MKFEFSENELKTMEIYPTVGTNYGDPFPKVEKLSAPITPKENMRRFFEHEKLCWVPDPEVDLNIIYPECVPDCYACKYEGGIDSFGVKWIPVKNNQYLPSFVDPNCILLEDIADWKKLQIPNVDSWDWAGEEQKYKDLDPDRMRKGIMLTGFFERMISLMGFEEAAASLITDPESVNEFMDAVLDYNLDVMEHYHKYLHTDVIIFHDDWSAQRAPFFSLAAANEFFAPRIKKMAERAHELGMYFIHHSCGNGMMLLPAYLSTGADAWQIQLNATQDNFLETAEKYGDRLLLETYITIETIDDEEAKNMVDEAYKKYGSTGKVSLIIFDLLADNRSFDMRKYAYEAARKCVY